MLPRPRKTKQISNRKRPSSKRLSNISLFDVSLMHVASFGCPVFPMQWLNYIQGWLLKLKPPKYTHTSRGVNGKARQVLPSPTLWKVHVFLLPPHLLLGSRSALLPLLAVPHTLASCPAPHCGSALGEGGTGRGAPHWRSRPRSSPVCSLAAPGLSGCAAVETFLDPTLEVWWCSSSPVGARGQNVKQGLVCGGDGNSGEVRRGEEPVPSQRTVSRRDVSMIQTVEATENWEAEMNVVWKRLPSILSMWNKEL